MIMKSIRFHFVDSLGNQMFEFHVNDFKQGGELTLQ